LKHAPLAPSAAERWIACPGSYQAEHEAPPAPAPSFADYGTYAHELFARALLDRLPAEAVTDDPVMRRPLALALDAARQILGARPFLVEIRLRPLAGLPSVWGTADVIGFATAGPVTEILDLKFGEFVGVAADTVQLRIYALLAARCYGLSDIGVTAWILQPRHNHVDGLARRQHYSREALAQFESELRVAATQALTPNAPRRAGPWCQWCSAALRCAIRQTTPQAVPLLASARLRPAPAG
jgi:hypothetical protein